MAKITLQYEFDFYEEHDQIKIITNSRNYWRALFDIDNQIRAVVKHGSAEWLTEDAEKFLESLRDLIYESGAMRDD